MRKNCTLAWLLAFFVLACRGDSETQTRSRNSTLENVKRATVTLQIYSGRVNPEWNLTGKQANELLALLDNLSESQPIVFPSHLGYTGFRVAWDENGAEPKREIIAYRGQILYESDNSKKYFADPERRLEMFLLKMFLLKTGDSTLDAQHAKRIEQEIKSPPKIYPTGLPR
ncbi:MAG: hypothetical protein ACJ8AC_03895 [Gemmatimonadaceae bacterium]